MHLPDINGFEVCQTLRSRPDTARVPVICLSAAYVKDDDKVHGLDAGADAYIVHPADPALLVENVRDDLADELRGYDRSPEAEPSTHLWRGPLATDLDVGEHTVEVRFLDPWRGEQRASTRYRLEQRAP